MKKVTSLILILVASFTSFGQITIKDYPKQFTCEVDATDQLEFPSASSACGVVTTKFNEEIFSGGCLGTVVRTIYYTDSCGNKAEAQQYITLTDNLEPTLYGVPKSIEIAADQAIPNPVMVSSRDNSGQNFEVIFNESKNANVITRKWTCTDACGNTAEGVQTITFK
jgi:large repetitive protein